ncbi:MAG TPA: RNA-binding protein [Eubacterium sp.]|nr:RNA-binding protein [Eubacterium sp.]HBZ53649.1 RNA-binding protein [Eubacterium sp.]
MIELGRYNDLSVVKKVDFGVYLGSLDEKVLLPAKEVAEGTEVGTVISVFIYRDSQDRLIATTAKPYIELGSIARLKVKAVNRVGAFLDWGLPKDLMMPYKEQTRKVEEGDEVLVACYIDKSDRLCATMKVYDYLKTESPYIQGDEVSGVIYNINPNFGAFVAIDDKYNAMIPKVELGLGYGIGDEVKGRVIKKREDGKLDISLRNKAYIQVNRDTDVIMDKLMKNGGRLNLWDKSDPQEIRDSVNMTKGQFKRAIGHLYKEGRIELKEGYIEVIRK